MKQYNVCFLGFGNVGRALARLLQAKSKELSEHYGIEFQVTGVASRRLGWLSKPNDAGGFVVTDLLSNSLLSEQAANSSGIGEWLQAVEPDIAYSATPTPFSLPSFL
ncbi:MAG TPA: hypothetical protein VMS31_17560 [Pyrinomonadaceae bacterium]|nr:hypothetical protein [Pyrinomonadaceae bacterium]